MTRHPAILHTVLDTTDVRELAEFYRQLLDLRYRAGDEPPASGPDTLEWLVLVDADGRRCLAFQQVEALAPSTWPSHDVPQQLHLDTTVEDREALEQAKALALSLGGRLVLDRTDDEEEPLYVIADPSGHPLCIFVGAEE